MQTEFLIIGQGLTGTLLSWYLHREDRSFVVIDEERAFSPSKIAAGIINPVTGRRMVKVWMAEDILPFAEEAYKEFGAALGIEAISQKNLLDFFPNPHHAQVFLERIKENDEYLHAFPEQNKFNELLNYELGCGEVRHCQLVHLEKLLPAWRDFINNMGRLVAEKFDLSLLHVAANGVRYKDISAEKIIFCDGISAAENPWFHLLPFAANKGEALIVDIPGLPRDHIYKKGFMLAPTKESLFWFGSNYQWSFPDDLPSAAFRQQAENHLKAWIKTPYTIVEHVAGIRPATLERRPFVGLHPHQPNIGILNGMGTKGCSLAPFFAHQLVQHLLYQQPIEPLADVKRFNNILRLSSN
jgi:glycine/D-amino acid oxidase-like deaminating enzyme